MIKLQQNSIEKDKLETVKILLEGKNVKVTQNTSKEDSTVSFLEVFAKIWSGRIERILIIECDNFSGHFLEILDCRNMERYGYIENPNECAEIVNHSINSIFPLSANK